MLVVDRLYAVALERGLRQSTLFSYERLLATLDILQTDVQDVSQDIVLNRLWALESPNTRRATVIALRTVFGWKIKIPRSVPRRYELADEDTLRLALMTSPHEARGLLMMYAGLRIGEACAITHRDVSGDRLSVTKQVVELTRTGYPTIRRIGPVKTNEAQIVIPHFMTEVVQSIEAPVMSPAAVRESLRRAGRRVGIQLTPHSLRHWYATTMLERGVALPIVRDQMRHSDIAVTLRTYVQYDATTTIHDTFG